MNALLKLSGYIDAVSEQIGKKAAWLVLAVALISAANAVVRYTFHYSSNAFLDIQWNFFSLIFLSCAGYTLLRNEHVRIDIISGRFSKRVQAWIDIFGILFFLLPMAIIVMVLSWPVFVYMFQSGEMSNSAGGLIMWPSRLMVPVGFFLLIMQALSELIKRVAFLKGLLPDPIVKQSAKSLEKDVTSVVNAKMKD